MTNDETLEDKQHVENNNKTSAQEGVDQQQSKADAEHMNDKSSKSKHKKTEKLEADLLQANDKFLRLYSEFDNYRKRTLKERIELSKTASEEVIKSLLPVLDDFERALKAFEISSESTDSLKHGIILIYNKFMNILSQQGLQPMNTIGEPFDTDFHEAITNMAVEDPKQKGRVIDEIEKGYTLSGKVIRYAKVVVGN